MHDLMAKLPPEVRETFMREYQEHKISCDGDGYITEINVIGQTRQIICKYCERMKKVKPETDGNE
jgi:hypothetical protein